MINKCGCGGEGEVLGVGLYYMRCKKCGVSTSLFATKEKTIISWNKANPTQDYARKDQTDKILAMLDDESTEERRLNYEEIGMSTAIDLIKEEFGG